MRKEKNPRNVNMYNIDFSLMEEKRKKIMRREGSSKKDLVTMKV